jgi:phosphoglycerate dehydrogenase-like enzyme
LLRGCATDEARRRAANQFLNSLPAPTLPTGTGWRKDSQGLPGLKLVIKKIDTDGRLSLVPGFLETPWDIVVADSDDLDAFERALDGADALISMSWNGRVPKAPSLRLLQIPGAGTDAVDTALLSPRTAVCNCFEHEIGIAEYVLGAMLEWVIGLRHLDATFRTGDWCGSYLSGPRHGELYGKTLAILGFGRIAREAAVRALAFGMQVQACSRTPREHEALVGRVGGMGELHGLLEEADFVLVTLPLDESTRGLVGSEALAAMKDTAVIINVSRGAVIDEQALYDALAQRRIGGAIIDVWYGYPAQGERRASPSRLPFHQLDNILMTPHASAWTDGLLPRRNRAVAQNLNRLARGEPLLNVVRAPQP